MSDTNNEGKEFSQEYVQELRRENAQWRTKYRELESRTTVVQELATRGVKADPTWVTMGEGQSAKEAVDAFVTKYPHLQTTQVSEPADSTPVVTQTPVAPTPTPQPSGQQPKPKKSTANLLKERNMTEIKKDPAARKAIREEYRAMLQQSSWQKDPTNY